MRNNKPGSQLSVVRAMLTGFLPRSTTDDRDFRTPHSEFRIQKVPTLPVAQCFSCDVIGLADRIRASSEIYPASHVQALFPFREAD
jgi:hypothetical protein